MKTWLGLILLGLGLTTTQATAQTRTVIDPLSGNMYIVTPQFDGGAHVNGFNSGTGSMWSTDIDGRGNMRGFDAQNNYWTYDRGSGTYMNLGTGTMCVGQGYARVCN